MWTIEDRKMLDRAHKSVPEFCPDEPEIFHRVLGEDEIRALNEAHKDVPDKFPDKVELIKEENDEPKTVPVYTAQTPLDNFKESTRLCSRRRRIR